MRKCRTRAGKEAWAFICWVIRPCVPEGATKTQRKAVAYMVFQVGEDFPQSRIDEASQERCGYRTKGLIVERARDLGLLRADSPLKRTVGDAADTDAHYIDRLRALQRIAPPDQAEALEWAIAQVAGRAPPHIG